MQFIAVHCALGGLGKQGDGGGVRSYLFVPGAGRPLGMQTEL